MLLAIIISTARHSVQKVPVGPFSAKRPGERFHPLRDGKISQEGLDGRQITISGEHTRSNQNPT